MKITMNRMILIVFFLLAVNVPMSRAEEKVAEFSPELKEICNQAMINIYKDILKVKDKYSELKNFDEKVLYENQYGIMTLIYKDTPEKVTRNTVPFELGLTIDKMEDVSFAKKANNFNFAFPMLGLKFTGYQTKRLVRSHLDVLPLVNKHGAVLSDYQQQFLPLRLTVRTLKDSYKVREDIEFEVILKNVSKRHMYVKSLGIDTLYFVISGAAWGTSPNSKERGGKRSILKAGESLSLKFKGESFQKPQDIDIYCAYRMSINGVNPANTLRVKIVGKQ